MRPLRFAWLAVVLACGGTTKAAQPSTSAAPADLVVHRLQEWAPFANASGYDTAETAVIRSTGAWRAAWTRIHGGMTPLPLLPAVDFNRNIVVLVAVGTQSSGGHGLAITRATVNAGAIRIHAVHTTPGVGCGVTMELTQPVDVVRLETRAPTVAFDMTTTVGTPCPGGE